MKRDIIWKIVESIKGDVNGKTPMIIANETSLSLSLVKSVLEKHSDIFTTVGSGSAYVLKKKVNQILH